MSPEVVPAIVRKATPPYWLGLELCIVSLSSLMLWLERCCTDCAEQTGQWGHCAVDNVVSGTFDCDDVS